MRRFGVWLAVLIASSSALAGTEVGNGGDVIVCEDGRVELLDYYEARTLRNITINQPSRSSHFADRVYALLGRLEKLDYWRAQDYKTQFAKFRKDALFVNAQLVDVPDSEHLMVPRGCNVQQLVIQKTPRFEGDTLYVFDKVLWDKMDAENQAGAVLHELIYREAIAYGHKDSINTRYLNSIISSDHIVTADFSKYKQIIRTASFLKLSLDRVEMSANARLTTFTYGDNIKNIDQVSSVENDGVYRISLPGLESKLYRKIRFSEPGKVSLIDDPTPWEPTFPRSY